MKHFILINLLFFTSILAMNSEDKECLFVSLGSHCEPCSFLREFNLRKAGYPFDWIVSFNHREFVSILDENFGHYLDELYFIRHPEYPVLIENTYYKIEFRHDWPFQDSVLNLEREAEQIEGMRLKYDRKITRFRNLNDYKGKVFFIRTAWDLSLDSNHFWNTGGIEKITYWQAAELKDALKRFFPSLNFDLVIVNYAEENTPPIEGIDGVIEFKIRKSNKCEDYRNMYNFLTYSSQNR
ncbi:MAG TPA: DUF1796 family putative cysteine peptidase [Chlamydiales bacterium]|nr:DUF1796 family putative cysteine peptidase [Chlamydiales bacterium]